ncbi:TRAP transporter small permease [Arthrobacter frigidicola]|nr:TRAP transporter small permease [Arthrobacter frigidicola]
MRDRNDDSPDGKPLEEPLIAVLPDADQLKKSGALWRVVEVLLAIGLLGMLVVLMIQIIGRFTGSSAAWTEEAARFLFMDGVFLGLAAGFRAAVHPRVSYFVAKGPRWLKDFSLHATVVCAVTFFGVLSWTSFELILQQIRTNETSPALALSLWIITVPLGVGAVLSLLGTIQSVYFDKDLRHRMLQGEVIA